MDGSVFFLEQQKRHAGGAAQLAMNLGAPARTATLKALLSQRLRERLV